MTPTTAHTSDEGEDMDILSYVGEVQVIEEEEDVAKVATRAVPRKKGTWTLSNEQEEEVVDWLRSNDFLWLRCSRDYHRKKAAWESKAMAMGITLEHLEKWWKNTKDWYIKIRKVKSGQGMKLYTERDRWLLTNLSFYKSKYLLFCCLSKILTSNYQASNHYLHIVR